MLWLKEKYFKALTGYFFHKKLYSNNRINFDDKDNGYFEQIKLRGINFEDHKDKKHVHTAFVFFNRLSEEEKKPVVMISGALHITLRIRPGARFFVPRKITSVEM